MTSYPAGFFRRHNLPRRARLHLLPPLLFAACALAARFDACAQNTDAAAEDVVRVETNLVTVPVFVTDARGRRVQNLTREDFLLRAAGLPVEIAYFAAGSERVVLTFLLDASGSTRYTITRQREAALALLNRFGGSSRVSVIRFREQPEIVVPFTTNREEVRGAFLLPAEANRRTAIFDAALAAVRAYENLKDARTERRIVVLISDGLDTVSTTRAASVIDAAQRLGVSLYVIHLPLLTVRDGGLAVRPTAKGFRELAERTGGKFFTLGDARATSLDPRATQDFAPVFQAIAEDLQGQYLLGFYAAETAARDNRPRPLDVSLISKTKNRLRVRALRENYTLSN